MPNPTNSQIEAALLAASTDQWQRLWAAVDDLEAEGEHAQWAGGQQLDTTIVDGAERPVLQMPYAIYSEAVTRTVEPVYEMEVLVPFDWSDWPGVERYRTGRGLAQAEVCRRGSNGDRNRSRRPLLRGHDRRDLEDGTLMAALRRIRRWFAEYRTHA